MREEEGGEGGGGEGEEGGGEPATYSINHSSGDIRSL